MRTTNQKIVSSWILYFTDIFTKSQRQKRPAAGGESCKAGFFLEIILCSFFLYTILIQENISLHYLFIIKDIMMIRSKGHKII